MRGSDFTEVDFSCDGDGGLKDRERTQSSWPDSVAE